MRDAVKGYVLCFTAVTTWAFSELTVKLLQDGVGPITLSFYRFLFGGLIVVFLMVLTKKTKGTWLFVKKNSTLLSIASMVTLGISNMIYFTGVTLVGNPGVSAALYTTYPLYISIYGIFILNERSNILLKILGFFIGFFGATILLTDFNFALLFQPDKILGNVLLLLSAGIWGFYSVLGKKLCQINPEIDDVQLKYTGLSNLLACVPIAFFLPFSGEIGDFFQHTAVEWLLILFMGFVITGLSLYIFFIGVQKIEVAHGISLSLLKPVLATIFSFIILGVTPPIALYVSIPIVSVAVLLINKRDKNLISGEKSDCVPAPES